LCFFHTKLMLMNTRKYPDEKLIADLRNNDDYIINEAFYYLYKSYYPMAANFVKHNNGSEAEAEDVFQESLIAFYENIRNKKFRGEASIKTYLYATVRNTWFTHLKKNKNTINVENPETSLTANVNEPDVMYNKELTELIMEMMDRIGDSCKKVLKYYYYDKLTMAEIGEKMNFGSVKSAKTQKYKCLKKLIELVENKPGLKDLLMEMS